MATGGGSKKSGKEKDGKDHRRRSERRGRSRDRREREDRDRRRRRDKEDSPGTTASRSTRSRSRSKAILLAAPSAPAAAAAEAATTEGVDQADKDQEDDEESEESEEETRDDNHTDIQAPAAKAEEKTAPGSATAEPEPEEKAPKSKDESEVPPRPGQSRGRLAPNANPPGPAKVPRTEVVSISSEKDDTSDKYSQYTCSVCGRKVGGGESGCFQHKRSPFHLANWVWNNSTDPNCSWQKCLQDGKNWSRLLWEKGITGPGSPNDKKRQTAPPPIRADPEKDKKGRRDQGPDKDPEGGSSASSGKSSLLVEMWQATLRELR